MNTCVSNNQGAKEIYFNKLISRLQEYDIFTLRHDRINGQIDSSTKD